ncbi:hypothetical protein AKJ62_04425 [candidate division MSBL1 archaeon SCGC-AAA259D14]|uniref:Uncharacterized protein n=3 Tax=candidate division MSBL1 TaxID=215777 RepID=A0A133U3P9_9EURY|nr:hypothetical protein AKJ62_04425 [candidate division MSBL1 archaeon SCGC-AAA259D14]KXA89757.1 hypothetical protein AKJ61_02145 [candidate division MSBL1 archaeon SCGC-AAA259B11]KXA97017.1 hypothetical protein AKJ39_03830 [candidate division MSBL1 archaeon SCGC-AAA259J03]
MNDELSEEDVPLDSRILCITRAITGNIEIVPYDESGTFPSGVCMVASGEFVDKLIQELKSHLGGEFASEFDPEIQRTIDKLEENAES